jgi:tRNA wybutosine-synthesizing protein 3
MNPQTFQQQKQNQLSKQDKSNEGGWDKPIKALCNKINKQEDYYTTSSCSGRIVLLKYSDKKIPDAFIFKTHEKTTFRELKKALEKTDFKDVEFQQSTCILHIACTSLEKAFTLVNKAKLAGWKRSGVMNQKRNIVELHSTENISFPIIKNNKILVDDDFLKIVIKEANNKLERTWDKIDRLKKAI